MPLSMAAGGGQFAMWISDSSSRRRRFSGAPKTMLTFRTDLNALSLRSMFGGQIAIAGRTVHECVRSAARHCKCGAFVCVLRLVPSNQWLLFSSSLARCAYESSREKLLALLSVRVWVWIYRCARRVLASVDSMRTDACGWVPRSD